MQGVILLFDEDRNRLEKLAAQLRSDKHEVATTPRALDFFNALERVKYDVAYVGSGEYDALELLRQVKHYRPNAEVILAVSNPSVDGAVEAVREGAFHYVSPLTPPEKISFIVQKAMEKRLLSIEIEELRSILRSVRGPQIIGESPAMQELKKTIGRVATMDGTVLVRGETGTGKELVSRAIHEMSHRADKKFLAVNCGALTSELLSNELFGHEKGAFTGAGGVKKGLFEAADGGTILLDEIGDTPPVMQRQLLRVLQEKTIMRVGGTEEIPVNVRVIGATNRSLLDDVENGVFREDLYYRLNIFILRIPPLRKRRDDIPLFCRSFLDKFNEQFGKSVERVSEEVMRVFMSYPFPGNVRELENVMERATALCDGPQILRRHLPKRMFASARSYFEEDGGDLPTLAAMEQRYIRRVLETVGGNKTEAARILGINRSSLWRKLKTLPEE
jgi:DNA-binding NtrC family response regulator